MNKETVTTAHQLTHPVVLFDGVCNLCNGAVQWIIRHDPQGRIRFASLQSELGQELQRRAGLDPRVLSSVVLYEQDRFYLRSDAILRLARRLGFPWSLAGIFTLIPQGLRDGIYDWIARHRYRWFGRREQCMIPTPALRERFLD